SARRDRGLLNDMIEKKALGWIDAHGVPATMMAQVGLALLDGEIARMTGNLEEAVRSFQTAAKTESQIPYTEPPYWHQPVSHILGAALLAANKPADAEEVYRNSLKIYRIDGWALFGLAQALDAQGKRSQAEEARK